MKLKELYSSEIIKTVEYFIPDEILENNFIIAGGFASWLLYLYKTVDDWDKFFLNLESGFIEESKNSDGYDSTRSIGKFGDIDIWIPENHPFAEWDIIHTNELYIQDLDEKSLSEKKKFIEASFKEKIGIGATLLKVSENAYTYKIIYDKKIKKAASILSVFNPSEGQSCIGNHEMRNSFQIIRLIAKSISDIFESFDLHHTRVAFYDGVLHFTEEAERTYDEEVIYPTEFFLERNDSIAIHCACRAFKYNERFGFNFSEELTDKIADLYINLAFSKDFSKLIDKYNRSVVNIFNGPNILSEYDPDYLFFSEVGEETLEKIRVHYLGKFLSNFKVFAKMPCFKDEYIGILICSDIKEIKNVLEDLLNE